MVSQTANLAKAVACNLWSFSPARLLARFPGADVSVIAAFGQMMNDFCSDLPNQPQPQARFQAQGGKCPVMYNFSHSWRAFRRDNGQQDNGSATRQILGPVTLVGVLSLQEGFRGYYARDGAGNLIQLSDVYSFDLWRNFSFTPGQFTRLDGLSDNCGQPRLDFLPPEVEEDDAEGIDFVWPFNFQPNVSIELPFRLLPRPLPPGINVEINGELNFIFDAGGINFNVGGNSGADVDLTPVINLSNEINSNVIVGQENIVNQIQFTIDQVNNVSTKVDSVSDVVVEVERDTRLIGAAENLLTTNETNICLTEETPTTSLFNALRVLSKELVEERQRECDIEFSDEELIAEGTSTISLRAFYVEVPESVTRARLELVGDLPAKATFYQTNEATGNFGALSAIANERAMGQTQTVFTRDTLLVIDTEFPLRELRVFLVPGISWKLYVVERI